LRCGRGFGLLDGVLFNSYRPSPPLSHFVEMLWHYDGYQQPHDKERLLPDGSMELVINLREDMTRMYDRRNIGQCQSLPGAIVVGAQSEFFVIDTAEQAAVIGVHFKPGGAFPFFNLPAGELRNEHVALETLWGRDARDLRERLLAAPTAEAKFRILEHYLWKRLAKPLERHPAVGFALREFQGARTVADVSGEIGLSARRFIEVFTDEVGLTPKLFCRVRRFQKVLRRIGMGQRVEWAAVALDCGYFDQAHFNHDFRAFSGLNPSAYAAQRTEHLNHVPILD
jgi:AraC-like DNA-binding protein